MGYESDHFPSYNELRNCYYSIVLNYTDFPSTPQISLQRPDPTISSPVSTPASAPPRYRVHKWGGMAPVPLWLPAFSKCTPVWGIIPRLLLPPPSGDIPTPYLPQICRRPFGLSGCLMVKPLQNLQYNPRHHPTLPSIQRHWLCHWSIHHPTGLRCCPRLHQHPWNNPPASPCFLQVL